MRTEKFNTLRDLKKYLKRWDCVVFSREDTPSNYLYDLELYARENLFFDHAGAPELKVLIPNTFIVNDPSLYVLAIDQDETPSNFDPPDGDFDGMIDIHEF